MRQVQIGIFAIGLVSFVASAFFVGGEMGDTLWRTGVAAMLLDMVFMRLWPALKP